MNRPTPPNLKLRSDDSADVLRPDVADLACLGELCQAFAEATGWPLRYVNQPEPNEDLDLLWSAPVNPGVGEAPGHLRIDLSGSSVESSVRSDWQAAERMAGSIAELVNELVAARHALWQREAELATAVPVTQHENESAHLAARLEATLQAGAQAIRCDSAALYLLDEATSQLKLRAAWGLPLAKLQDAARPLADQMADLEALLGHAVALESPADMVGPWQSPEPAGAALCVPVSSPTNPLGTLWLFSRREREFTDEQTNIAEVVAGKIASDLERTVLLQQRSGNQSEQKQIIQAARVQQHQLPAESPPLEGWNVNGWAEQSGSLGGAFYDWRMIDNSSLLVMLGDACDGGIEAALASTALRAALRAEDDPEMDVAQILARANRILWETSAGSWWAGMWLGQIKLDEGHCDYATFGRPTGLWLRNTPSSLPLPRGEGRGEGRPANKRTTQTDQNTAWASLIKPTQPLGLEPLTKPEKKRIILAPGDSLVVCNRGIMETSDQRGRSLEESVLANTLLDNLRAPPSQMIDMVRELIQNSVWDPKPQDRSMLVVQRSLR